MSPELLDKIANRMIEQALAAQGVRCDAETIAHIDRQIEAGQAVTIEELGEEPKE